MNIQGIQKLTLLDYPGKMACIIFTGGCNFRCPFCHNSSLVINPNTESAYSDEELFAFLNKRKKVLDGVVISGGEPLIQPDIEEYIRKIRNLGFLIKLDTNGTFPEKLIHLCNEGLIDYVAMDVKSSKANYSQCVGIKNYNIDKINESIEFLKNGNIDYEFRTTVAKGLHTEDDIKNLGEWIKGSKRHYIQQFKNSGDIIGFGLSPFSEEELVKFKSILSEYVLQCEIRGL